MNGNVTDERENGDRVYLVSRYMPFSMLVWYVGIGMVYWWWWHGDIFILGTFIVLSHTKHASSAYSSHMQIHIHASHSSSNSPSSHPTQTHYLRYQQKERLHANNESIPFHSIPLPLLPFSINVKLLFTLSSPFSCYPTPLFSLAPPLLSPALLQPQWTILRNDNQIMYHVPCAKRISS